MVQSSGEKSSQLGQADDHRAAHVDGDGRVADQGDVQAHIAVKPTTK